MPVHHRLRFLTFPMRTSRLCSLWPDMRPLRFRRVPFGRDVAFDRGGATASRIAMPHMLPSTVPSVSASAKFFLSWLNPTPHPITVYASHPPSPTTAQHSLPGGALPPYRGRSFTGRIASASPDAPEVEFLWGSGWHPTVLAMTTAQNDYAFETVHATADGLVLRRNNLAQRNVSVIELGKIRRPHPRSFFPSWPGMCRMPAALSRYWSIALGSP